MKIIDEIRRQAKRVILSPFAFEQLLAEKDGFGLQHLNTQTIPPTVYGMSISVVDKPGRDVAVLPGAQTL